MVRKSSARQRGGKAISLTTARERYAPERTILIDFDGTLCPFTWPASPGAPYPGVVDTLKRFKEHGLIIAIFTARAWSGWDVVTGREGYRDLQITEAQLWLNRHGIPYDYITAEKVPALFMLDDRAIRVDGWADWEEVATEVFEAYERGQYGRHRTD